MGDEKLYNDVHNYTKFKLVEILLIDWMMVGLR